MLSDPTYDYQINQFDRRWTTGGRYERLFKVNPNLSLTAGVEGRYDNIGNVGVEHTQGGVFVEPISRHEVMEGSLAAYTEAHRRGYEIVAFWRPMPWLALDGVWTGSHARYDGSPDAKFVAGAVEDAGEFGASAVKGRWEASMRVRYLGDYPLIEDNSLRADAETIVNVRGAWKPGHFTCYGEVLNLFDGHGKDIVYCYGANVSGLDPAGEQVDGRMSRAEEPRTVRVGVKYEF